MAQMYEEQIASRLLNHVYLLNGDTEEKNGRLFSWPRCMKVILIFFCYLSCLKMAGLMQPLLTEATSEDKTNICNLYRLTPSNIPLPEIIPRKTGFMHQDMLSSTDGKETEKSEMGRGH